VTLRLMNAVDGDHEEHALVALARLWHFPGPEVKPMDLGIKGKRALVTGSTAGIGLAIAKALAAEGAEVIVNGRTEARVAAARKEVGYGALGFAGDVSTEQGREALLAQFPEVDILVNNMGYFEAKPLSDITAEDWRKMFDVNVVSGARLTQAYLPKMLRQNAGRVIFIASESGVNVPPDMIHYGVSKASQIALARGIAETTAGTGVTVNTVLPGPTRSEGVSRFLGEVLGDVRDQEKAEREFLKQLRPTSLIQRFAAPEEVASLVAYLAGAPASATNGAALRVEGGLLRGIL
jgi:NAD(P)-dependent dehydrogenase (short-subunit alcohol dehydrogenase family)